jgi:hypothetical protein
MKNGHPYQQHIFSIDHFSTPGLELLQGHVSDGGVRVLPFFLSSLWHAGISLAKLQ